MDDSMKIVHCLHGALSDKIQWLVVVQIVYYGVDFSLSSRDLSQRMRMKK